MPLPDQHLPTVFHITHWKAGSQWIRAVLEQAARDRIVPIKEDMSHVCIDPIVTGGVYTPVYLTRETFTKHAIFAPNQTRFLIIRDLRDTLVSWYFSMKVSHGLAGSLVTEVVGGFRQTLNKLPFEEGMLFLMDYGLADNGLADNACIANIQLSWLHAGETVFRYEELLADEQETFRRIFAHCGFNISDERRKQIVEANSFERQTGRRRGLEDIMAHHRKGIHGDWRNHFTPRIKSEFKDRLGQVLIETGYESNFDW